MNTVFMRTIRSFARRAPALSPHQKNAIEQHWSQLGLTQNNELLDFKKIFDNDHPVIIEIGFGMGHTFIMTAEQNPDKNYIGIEVHRPGIANVIHDAAEKNLKNIRIVDGDAVETLKQQIPDHSLEAIYLFFPDPWPKTRHHKRRLVQPEFMALVHNKLKLGGIFHAATDWEHYAQHMMRVLSDAPSFENLAGVGQYTPRPEQRPLTKFEKRGHRLGHGTWDLVFCTVRLPG